MLPICNTLRGFPSQWTQFQGAQDQAWSKATEKSSRRDVKEDDNDEDLAKPLVAWQGVWNDAVEKHGLTSSAPDEQPEKSLLTEDQSQPTLANIHSGPSSPTFSRSSLVFSDRQPSPASSSKTQAKKPALAEASADPDQMFKRYNKTKVYATDEVLGGSWMVVRKSDTEEKWEIVDGEDVEDKWDFVPEQRGLGLRPGRLRRRD